MLNSLRGCDSFYVGGLAGLRMRRFGGEVSYTRSSHVGMWNGTTEFESRQETVGVDLRIYPLRWGRFEPFALLGACFVKLTVLDGVTDGSVSVDAAYWGLGLDLGGGISLGIGKRLSLIAQAVYHWARYNTVDDFWGANLDHHGKARGQRLRLQRADPGRLVIGGPDDSA
jgi:hypothetical protein